MACCLTEHNPATRAELAAKNPLVAGPQEVVPASRLHWLPVGPHGQAEQAPCQQPIYVQLLEYFAWGNAQ